MVEFVYRSWPPAKSEVRCGDGRDADAHVMMRLPMATMVVLY